MANITRTDPFQELIRFDPFRDLESFTTLPSLRRFFQQMPAEPTIKLDVTEDDKAYHVKAELPGVKKDDIAVEIDGNMVSISAEVKRNAEQKEGERIVRSERYYGTVSRAFSLGTDIDESKCQAKYQDGVLELVLAKKAGGRARQIAVN